MKNLQIRKTVTALAMASLTLVSLTELMPGPFYYTSYTKNTSYSKENPTEPYASLEIGDIYIGKACDIEKLNKQTQEDNIIIIDQRASNDPNVKILASHKITNPDEIASVIGVVQEYNREYPSNWSRTTSSLVNEWEVHNICSSLEVMPSHTDDVDLNNSDEIIYNSKLLSKILNP